VHAGFTILITDRNPRVSAFLQREMRNEGYGTRVVQSAREVLEWAFDRDPVDLIILDPDLPDTVDSHLLRMLRQRMPPIPVILHAHPSPGLTAPDAVTAFIRVEKGGNSVERLKEVAAALLRRPRPATVAVVNGSSSGA
jgi:DNA-binding NtrC family response regulator